MFPFDDHTQEVFRGSVFGLLCPVQTYFLPEIITCCQATGTVIGDGDGIVNWDWEMGIEIERTPTPVPGDDSIIMGATTHHTTFNNEGVL